MISLFCFRCCQVSNFVEGLRCPHCDGDGFGIIMAANLYSAVPENGNVSPGYYVTVEDASTQVSEEDLVPLEPTREASTQVSEEELEPVEPTREASTQTSDDEADFLLQIVGCHGSENCAKIESPPQNETAQDLDQYSNEHHSSVPADSNTNEGEFHNQTFYICNASSVQESTNDRQQTHLCERTSFVECKNKYDSDELLRRQGTIASAELVNKVGELDFTDSVTYESENPILNYILDSSDNGGDRHDKGEVPPAFSSLCRRNPSVSNCFQENFATANTVAQQKSQTSNLLSRNTCEKCRKHFFKESTFYTHKQSNCDPKRFKCDKCDKRFSCIQNLSSHRKVHSREKPFKCTRCDYASKWQQDLKKHLKRHTNIPPFSSSFSRRNQSVNKSYQENSVTSQTVKQKNPQSSNKLEIMKCKRCRRYFLKESTFSAHVQSNCNPNPYKCEQCEERFSSKNGLIAHQSVHSGEKPFKCTQCDYASKWPHLLKKHLETHH